MVNVNCSKIDKRRWGLDQGSNRVWKASHQTGKQQDSVTDGPLVSSCCSFRSSFRRPMRLWDQCIFGATVKTPKKQTIKWDGCCDLVGEATLSYIARRVERWHSKWYIRCWKMGQMVAEKPCKRVTTVEIQGQRQSLEEPEGSQQLRLDFCLQGTCNWRPYWQELSYKYRFHPEAIWEQGLIWCGNKS